MRKFLFPIILFLSILSSSFADDVNENQEITVADFIQHRRISPFELSSVNFSYLEYDNNILPDATGRDRRFFKKGKIRSFQLSIEKPIYQKYLAYELKFAFNAGFTQADQISMDTILSLVGRLPVQIGNAGDIALRASAGLGVSSFIIGRAGKVMSDKHEFGGVTIEYELEENRFMYLRFGTIINYTIGMEYHPLKWLGVYVDVATYLYDYSGDQFKKNSFTDRATYSQPFKLQIKNKLLFGIRVTF